MLSNLRACVTTLRSNRRCADSLYCALAHVICNDSSRRCRNKRLSRGECFDLGSLRMDAGQEENEKATNADNIELRERRNRTSLKVSSPTRYHSWKCRPMFFSDGIRRVDYVLAYETNESSEDSNTEDDFNAEGQHDARTHEEKRATKRHYFEENLRRLGLQLEHVEGKYCNNTHFVLIHAPFGLLLKQAENLCVKMPVQQSDVQERTIIDGVLDRFLGKFRFLTFSEETNERLKEPNYFTAPFVAEHLDWWVERTIIDGVLDRFLGKFRFLTFSEETNERLKEPNYFTAPFVAEHLDCYVGSDDPGSFFESSERSRMVYDLLLRTRYDSEETEKYRVGIERLVKNGTYTAAYPLHEPCEEPKYDVKRCSNREMLYWNWCRFNNFYKYQPLSLIRFAVLPL
ncbi:Anoctamin-5 [Toxocara canis]|uniref:Anoctamin-5 n=1 Tax=Toxocara canis TaxID=6265 RepID=A0A0B2W4H3_TOXCA|nr:Anoctamin-5 [Toxocara canis]